MNCISYDNEKGNGAVPFCTWDGRMVIAVPCGGWRYIRPLDLAPLRPVSRQVVIIRDMEG